jgi:hypothetical protein
MMSTRFSLILALLLFLTACTTPASVKTSTPEPQITIQATFTPDPAMGTVSGKLMWLPSGSSESLPVPNVTLQLERHSDDYLKYKSRSDAEGRYEFSNVEPGSYGIGVYLNLQLGERKCDAPEYVYSRDLEWVHYASWGRVDVWYDVIFSSKDITVKLGETVELDFTLKCP